MHSPDPSDLVLRDLVDTLIQERLCEVAELPTSPVRAELADGERWCGIGRDLVFRGRDGGALQRLRLSRGPVWLARPGQAPRALDPDQVLVRLTSQRHVAEVVDDLRLAVDHARFTLTGWSEHRAGPHRGLLAGERLAATRNRPFHPTARATTGWSPAELERYGPMRAAPLALDWVAVRSDRLRLGGGRGSHGIEHLLLDGRHRLPAPPDGFQLLPVHPWQFDHVLAKEFAGELAAGDIVPLTRELGRFRPTSTLRTLEAAHSPGVHVKLPLGVATLGAARLLPPRYLDNAERAQHSMLELLERDAPLAELVELCDESTWCGWRDPDEFADRPGHLAALVRRYPPGLFDDPDAVVLPMAALAAEEWGVIGGMLRGAGFDPADPVGLYEILAKEFCTLALGFLRHGLQPELHGQNVVVVLAGGGVRRFVLRDHDTLRLYSRWMRASGVEDPGYRIKPGAPQSLCLASGEELLGYLQTLGFEVNLYGIADALARHYGLDERVLWRALRRAIVASIERLDLRGEVADVVRDGLLWAPQWPSRQVLEPLLRTGRSADVSMPAGAGRVPNPLWHAGSARALAERAARQRLLNAYLRESGREVSAGGHIPLSGGRALDVELRHRSAFGHHVYGDAIRLDGVAETLTHPEFVAVLLGEVEALVPSPDGARTSEFATEIENSIEATTHFLGNERRTPQPASLDSRSSTRQAEQSLTFGHPFHPTPKSTVGFGAELGRYAPELGARFRLHWLAVRPDTVLERRVLPGSWVPPDVRAHALSALGRDRADYPLLPVHPWQAGYLARQRRFGELLDEGVVVALGELGAEVYPTSSVRTVCDPAFETSWKLPLHVRVTNFIRNNPVEQLRRATDAAALLATLAPAGQLPGFSVLSETGFRTVDPAVVGDELAAEVAVLYRANPFTDGRYTPHVLAGLLEEVPGGEPLLIAEIRRAGLLSDVAGWLRRYLLCWLGLLDVFDAHGVSFEAHVQNCLLHTEDGRPSRIWVRDLEGASVARSHAADVPRDSPLLYDDEEAWLRLRYHAVTNHLGHLIHVLGRYGGVDEGRLWRVAADRLAGHGSRSARALLTARTLPAKANLLSRFAERGENPLYVDVQNPLREVAP